MKAVLQRVNSCSITVKGEIVSTIDKGILLFVGITNDDEYKDADKLVEKITKIGIFEDDNGKISLNIREEKGEIMIVSQITLIANLRKGKKPDFSKSASSKDAKHMYEYIIERFKSIGIKTSNGIFGEYMEISLENDGPVTYILDTRI